MDIREILNSPLVYQTYQAAGGFFNARLKAISMYLPLKRGDRIIDIGCGPGFIVKYLPSGISYLGFDTDAKYISYAAARFGLKGGFVCGFFDEVAAREYGPADVVMMNGLLHHLGDDEVDKILGVIKGALGPAGRLFTLDGCFTEEQSALARILLQSDRGKFVRKQEEYRLLIMRHFKSVDVHVESRLSWMPYTWIVMVAQN
jgi:SAM-dependent methyltransferase